VERVSSGIGIPNIYEFLRDEEKIPEQPETAELIASSKDRTRAIASSFPNSRTRPNPALKHDSSTSTLIGRYRKTKEPPMTTIGSPTHTNIHCLRDALTQLEKEGSGLGHFNVADLVLLKAVIAAASDTGLPVLVGASEGEREFFGARQLAAAVKRLREETGLPVFLNADHTHSLKKAVEAAQAGFDSVGVDFSALPFEQNVAHTKEVVQAIKVVNPAIVAEGEVGDIGTGSEIKETAQGDFKNLTTPEEARQFVQATGIDILAPAVGNRHGMLKSMVQGKTKKHLDIERIAQIKRAAGVFLTLHGGSGTEDEHFRKAIAAGINIIHINTELRVAWRDSLAESLARDSNEVVPYKILRPVVDSVKQVVSSRLRLFMASR
jgi:fructose-bisphosphate aldolase class II